MIQKENGYLEFKYKASNVSVRIEDYRNSNLFPVLNKIYISLEKYRGNNGFVHTKKLQRCDIFLPSNRQIVELDEVQHFSFIRNLSLKNYPKTFESGYDVSLYQEYCNLKNAKDNDPKYRDEQRAWYDTIRDFLPCIIPEIIKKPTIRIPLGFHHWCKLDPDSGSDLKMFRQLTKT